MTKLFMKFKKFVKKLLAKFGKGKKGKNKGDEKSGELVAVEIPDHTFGEQLPVKVGGESHTLASEEKGGGRVVVRSAPQTVDAFLSKEEKENPGSKTKVSAARSAASTAQAAAAKLAEEKAKLTKKKLPKDSPEHKAALKTLRSLDRDLETKLKALRGALSQITGTVVINTSRLWSGKGRPGGFRKSTLKALADKFPDSARAWNLRAKERFPGQGNRGKYSEPPHGA